MLEKTNASNLTALKLAMVGVTAVGGSTLSAVMNNVAGNNHVAHADTLTQNQNTNNQKTYKVVKGDSVWKIARDNNVKVQDVINWNHLGSDAKIVTGQTLNLTQPTDDNGVYTVVKGDTLNKIAQSHNLNLNQLFQFNPQYNVNKTLIKVGDKINVTQDAANRNNQQTTATQASTTTTAQTTQAAPATTTNYTQGSANPGAGLTGGEQAAKEWIAARESSGNYNARNGQYIGRYQLSASYLGGDYSPANQERVANNYVHNRYGSWTAAQQFWQSHGWY